MAAVRGNWTKALTLAVLLLGAWRVSLAQSVQSDETGSLAGRLTDLHSNPLEGVSVTLRHETTGAEATTTTAKNGAYHFSELEPGEYSLEAKSPDLGRGKLEEIVVAGGHESRAQTALDFEPLPHASVHVTLRETEPAKTEEQFGTQRPAITSMARPASKVIVGATPPQAPAVSRRPVEVASPAPVPILEPGVVAQPLKTPHVASQKQNSPIPVPAVPVPAHAVPANAAAVSSKPGQPVPGPAELTLARLGPLKPALSAPGPGMVNQALSIGRGAALVAIASRAAQAAAMQIAQARYQPVLASSEESGPAAPVQTTRISAVELQALPVSGRHWQDFVLDNTPTSATPAAGQAEISLQGAGQQRTASEMGGIDRGLAFGSTNSSGQASQGQGPMGQGGDGPAGMARLELEAMDLR